MSVGSAGRIWGQDRNPWRQGTIIPSMQDTALVEQVHHRILAILLAKGQGGFAENPANQPNIS
jgi:hypothetical protein